MPGTMGEVEASKMRCKGSVLRGYLAVLEREALLATVRERASPELRRLIDDPPAASAWIPSAPTEEISAIVASVEGLARCRAISHTAARDGVVPLLRKAVEGFLRLFGAKPPTLLSRMDVLTKSTMEGIEFAWQPAGANSGYMTFRYPFRRNMPQSTFHAAAGSISVILDLCGGRGSVSDPEPLDVPERNAVRFRVEWT